jgi:hypothetical protein
MPIRNDVGAKVNFYLSTKRTYAASFSSGRHYLEKMYPTPITVQTGSRAVLESVVERGMSNFYWDSNSIPAARTVTRCYD